MVSFLVEIRVTHDYSTKMLSKDPEMKGRGLLWPSLMVAAQLSLAFPRAHESLPPRSGALGNVFHFFL